MSGSYGGAGTVRDARLMAMTYRDEEERIAAKVMDAAFADPEKNFGTTSDTRLMKQVSVSAEEVHDRWMKEEQIRAQAMHNRRTAQLHAESMALRDGIPPLTPPARTDPAYDAQRYLSEALREGLENIGTQARLHDILPAAISLARHPPSVQSGISFQTDSLDKARIARLEALVASQLQELERLRSLLPCPGINIDALVNDGMRLIWWPGDKLPPVAGLPDPTPAPSTPIDTVIDTLTKDGVTSGDRRRLGDALNGANTRADGKQESGRVFGNITGGGRVAGGMQRMGAVDWSQP